MLTLAGLVALAVLVLAFNQDIGFVSLTIGLGLSLIAPNLQKRAIGQVSWPEIMLDHGCQHLCDGSGKDGDDRPCR